MTKTTARTIIAIIMLSFDLTDDALEALSMAREALQEDAMEKEKEE